MRTRTALIAALSLALSLGLVIAGSGAANASPGIHRQTAFRAQASMALLTQLRVAPEQQGESYEREYFGGWRDADGDRCNTRKEVLLTESTTPVTVAGSCTLQGGSWVSSYDNAQTSIAGTVDIDHMVPLKEAWVSGAYGWNLTTLRSYANDLGYEHSLIAVSASSNRKKSDQDPATWMPSNTGFVCEYVGRWVAVKYRWSLAVDDAERDVLGAALQSCGASAEVAVPQLATVVAGSVIAQSPAAASSQGVIADAQPGGTVFENCDALNAVYPGGVASTPESVNLVSGAPRATRYPLTVDAALYAANASRDRDKDGVACER